VRGGGRREAPSPGPARIYFNIARLNPAAGGKPVIVWRNPTVRIAPAAARRPRPATSDGGQTAPPPRRPPQDDGPRQTLRSLVSAETARKLNFGASLDGSAIGPDDFASEGSFSFEIPMPATGAFNLDLQVDAELGSDRDQVFRVLISDSPDGGERGGGGNGGRPTRVILGDMESAGYRAFRSGVMEFATILPPNSHGEPTPADKDPIPDPFDNTYNVPEHDEFVVRVKYLRDDRFVAEKMLDAATRARLDHAWSDLLASFEYHDAYLNLLAQHYKFDLKGKRIAEMDEAAIASLPAEMAKYVAPLRAGYLKVQAAQAAARPGHVNDCIEFASRAWRRPLTEREKQGLRSFYDRAITADGDHRKAIRALLARILVAPQFLYRFEQASDTRPGRAAASAVKPLTGIEMASRLSYFLWASIPDEELRRAASSGELNQPAGLERQARRMLADPKARRFATEFFGQWLGFYHFDEHKGVDTDRFPEFTAEVRESMYDEAISFFEHIVRKDRPVKEILFADYTFLNEPLAKFYGVKREMQGEEMRMAGSAREFQRGGLLRMGAVLTATSAPLRTSPVKRGDWILRRVLGTPSPPPPADAGSIPADDKDFGGLTVKARLEMHKRNAVCANCHARIDPLGFALERYDSTGRWRDRYADGKPIEDAAALADNTEIAGVDGLLEYLKSKDAQVRRTLAAKLLGYALGRTILVSDRPLLESMVEAGGDAPFSTLVTKIVLSRQFRNRVAKEEAPAPAKIAAVPARPREGVLTR
jgi:hypothetical protein